MLFFEARKKEIQKENINKKREKYITRKEEIT
jgi:hypothetical protein